MWFGFAACWGLLLLASAMLLPDCVRSAQLHEVGDAAWLLGILLTLLACAIGMTLSEASWSALREGVAALPFGRVKLG